MCDPVTGMTAAGFAISAGSAAMRHAGQGRAAARNAREANAAATNALMQLGERQQQEVEASQGNILALDRQARQVKALAAVAAGEAGVAGASVDAVLSMAERDAATGAVTVGRNLRMTQEQLSLEGRNILAQRRGRIMAVPRPSVAETALEYVGAAANAAGTYYGKKP